MQRCISNRLQRGHSFSNHSWLVNAGGADVYIKNMGAHIDLLKSQTAYIVQVLGSQRFLQAFFASGIDAFADNNRPLAQMHSPAIAGHGGELAVAIAAGLQVLTFFNHSFDMRRSGATAAAYDARALLRKVIHQLGIFLGTNLKAGFPILFYRQACIRIDDDGQASSGQHLRQQLSHLHGAQAAVEAHGVHAQALAHQRSSLYGSTGEQLAILVKGHGYAHGQIAVFLGG